MQPVDLAVLLAAGTAPRFISKHQFGIHIILRVFPQNVCAPSPFLLLVS